MIRILLRGLLLVFPWLTSCGPDPQLKALQAETETLTHPGIIDRVHVRTVRLSTN